jgi:tryptophanase
MSARQWAALMLGDESYAGSASWHRFENTVREITSFKHIFPTHQGRAAERILAATRLKPGEIVPNNSHFDTTRANIEYVGAHAVDLPTPQGKDIYSERRFKGNMDIDGLETLIASKGAKNIPFCMITVTNNAGGGQPVSMENIWSVKETPKKYHSIAVSAISLLFLPDPKSLNCQASPVYMRSGKFLGLYFRWRHG